MADKYAYVSSNACRLASVNDVDLNSIRVDYQCNNAKTHLRHLGPLRRHGQECTEAGYLHTKRQEDTCEVKKL